MKGRWCSIFRKNFRVGRIFICIFMLAVFSILTAGGFERISGINHIGIKLWENQYMLYGLGQGSPAGQILKNQYFFRRSMVAKDPSEQPEELTEAMVQMENDMAVKEEPPVEQENKQISDTYTEPVVPGEEQKNEVVETLKRTLDYSYLMKNFFIVDGTTSVTKDIFPVKKLLTKNLSIVKKQTPQILIYHTHGASEAYADSREGVIEDTVIGTGRLLANELKNTYGYTVIHDETKYDLIDGAIDRSLAYNKSLAGIQKTLKENPDIEVVIDLHRDGVGGKQKNVTEIGGKKTAQVMFFNGLSRGKNGEIAYLKNRNRQGNLAFSLQLKCLAMEQFPGLTKPIYLKGYRYNLHVKERSLLIELGNQNNTVGEIQNAVGPLAKILSEVLTPKK